MSAQPDDYIVTTGEVFVSDDVDDSNQEADVTQPTENEDEAELGETADTETVEEEAEKEPEQKHTAQARIRQLANEKAALKIELAEMQDLLRDRLSKDQGASQENTVTQRPGKPNPADYAGGVFNDEYVEAITDYKLAIALENRDRKEKQYAEIQAIKAKEDSYTQDHPDYPDAIAFVLKSSLIDSEQVYSAIAEDDNGPALMYHLSQDPSMLATIAAMPLHRKIMTLGALSAKLQARDSTEELAPAQKPKVSKAAPPITPIKGGRLPLSTSELMEAAEKSGDYDAWKAAKKAAKG